MTFTPHDVVLGALTGAPPEWDTASAERLHEQLLERARYEGVLDLSYTTVDSPVGALLLAATPVGLARVAFADEGHEAVLTDLAERVSGRILHDRAGLDVVVRQLDDYFAGRRRRFDLPVDLRLAHGFRREVLERLRLIPYGATVSYGILAQQVGSPRAARAVGSACATNPIPLVVPCHRVVRGDGSLGQYLGGVSAKRALLDLETSGLEI